MINVGAVELWNSCFADSDRLLILGGSGWFGRTAHMMTKLPRDRIMSIGSHERKIDIEGLSYSVTDYDFAAIAAFAPTVVLDFWFLTREKIETHGEAAYCANIQNMIDRTSDVVALPSVSRVVSVSSGASVSVDKNQESGGRASAYGVLKSRSEQVLTKAAATLGFKLAIARVYSVSGALVTRPQNYAFSNLALQALSGEIVIEARTPVRRRFVAVEDVLAVALSNLASTSNSFSSGGEKIEIGDLAGLFGEILGRDISIKREGYPSQGHQDNYFSDDKTWGSSVEAAGFVPLTLREQAENVLDFFSARKPPWL